MLFSKMLKNTRGDYNFDMPTLAFQASYSSREISPASSISRCRSHASNTAGSFGARGDSWSIAIKFSDFLTIYENYMKPRIRKTTWATKRHIILTKREPLFCRMEMEDIRNIGIICWKNKLMNTKCPNREACSSTHLRIINNQVTAIFNHTARYYCLYPNPTVRTIKISWRDTILDEV